MSPSRGRGGEDIWSQEEKRGFFGPWGKLCLSAEESSELDPAALGMVIGWCWIKSQQAEGEGKFGACALCWWWWKSTSKVSWVPCHGKEHLPHRTAPPAAKMGPRLETGGLRIFHVSPMQALQFQRVPDPKAPFWMCSLQWGAVVSVSCTRLLWLSCLRGAIHGHPHSNAANSTPLYCTIYTFWKSHSVFSKTGEQWGSSHSCCKYPFFLQQQKSDGFHMISWVAVIIILPFLLFSFMCFLNHLCLPIWALSWCIRDISCEMPAWVCWEICSISTNSH